MLKRDLYRVLGVSTQAAPGEIRRAYRRIAFTVHPDTGEHPDPDRFREVHEAYEILKNPARRRSYDIEIAIPRVCLSAEPLRPKAPVPIFGNSLTMRLSVEEFLDHAWRNFIENREKSGGDRRRSLRTEAIMNAEEARFGCRLPFSIPYYTDCPTCGGADWQWLCPDCNGGRSAESVCDLVLEIPPGVRDGDRFDLDLDDVGIGNLALEIRVVVV